MNNSRLFVLVILVGFLAHACLPAHRQPTLNPERPPETTTAPAPSVPETAVPHETAAPGPEAEPSPADAATPASDATEARPQKAVQPAAGQSPDSGKKVQSFLDEALDFVQVAQEFWQNGELDNALEALDQAFLLILKGETYDNFKLIQQKEDLRFLISKRILEIYASRNIVVNGNHNAIPLDLNRHVQAEIDRFTKGPERRFFVESYRRSGIYRPRIIEELRQAGLPEELSWLPLIESGFNIRALSPARALGLWQFIPSTGYKFGLKRDLYIDERLDPEKATQAAIAYMKELHQIFGDWTTVLAAYNCGEGRVLRVIRNQNINYLDNFWDLYERLPLETARYVPRFLATLHIVQNPEKYGIDTVEVDAPVEYETAELSRRMHLRDVAQAIDTPLALLKNLNSELRYSVVPPDKYTLRVPAGKKETLLAGLDRIRECSPPRRAFVHHRVKPGETLSTIARRYRTSIRSIAVANNINRKNFIVAGQKLKIPQKGIKIYPTSEKTASAPVRRPATHVVKSGDSLWILAKRYGTTVKEIQDLNGLRNARLHINQVLRIPGREPEAPQTRDALKTYSVRRGDSPYTIANRHNIPLKRFLQINQLTPMSKIYPGQTLYVE